MIRVSFLGTSHGIPEPGRRCSCTMIEIGERIYFIDMGMQAIEDLRTRGIAPERVKGVFITHMHGDHTAGLASFVDLCNWYFKAADPQILLPTQAGIDALRAWTSAMVSYGLREMKIGLVREGVAFDDGVLRVTAYRTQHCDASYAYELAAEGKRLFFTGDLKRPDVDLPPLDEKRYDLFVGECAHFDAIYYADALRGREIAEIRINHWSPRFEGTIPALVEALAPTPVSRAFDHLEITI